MKRHRETILPRSPPKGLPPAVMGRAAAMNTQGENTQTAHVLKERPSHMHSSHFMQKLHSHELLLCLHVDQQASRQNDTESHEKLAQRIEKDVVSVFIHTDTGPYITQLLSRAHDAMVFKLNHSICLPQQILNCSLDDIEIFVARLQKATEAFSQLNQRHKSKKNKKKGPAGLSPFLLLWWHGCSDNMLVLLTLPCFSVCVLWPWTVIQ